MDEHNVMVSYCSGCGKKLNPTDNYCGACGAARIESVNVQKKELPIEKPSVSVQAPTKMPKTPIDIILNLILQVIILLLVLAIFFLIVYSFSCAAGLIKDTQDQMCQSLSQSFSGEDVVSDSGGTQAQLRGGCSPGYCWSNGVCCPSSHRYSCGGNCYASSQEAMSASQGRCTSFKAIC